MIPTTPDIPANASPPDWSWMTALMGPFVHPGGEALSRRVLELASVEDRSILLDLGAGAGATVDLARRLWPGLKAFALDPNPFPLSAPRPSGGAAVRAEGGHLPIRGGSVDALISECALCLLGPLDSTLEEAARVVRSEGRLVFSDFYGTERLTWSSEPLALWACVLNASRKEEILSALGRAGFERPSLEDHTSSLWEIEERVQKRVDVIGLVSALALSTNDPFWRAAETFLDEVRRERDAGRMRYGIFSAERP